MKHLLTIAGSDSCGGAGIQADLKTFSALGTYGMSVITAVTAQNTTVVSAIHELPASMVKAQIDSIFDDIKVDAVKIGMVASENIVQAIAAGLSKYRPAHIVMDPVMLSKSGSHLLHPQAQQALVTELLPLCTLLTPNLPEAAAISGISVARPADMEAAARIIYGLGAPRVLVKGGHLEGRSLDVFYDGDRFSYFDRPRIETNNTHGTGCTFSAAIAAFLARGWDYCQAIELAKEYISTAIAQSFAIGKGWGPVHHFYHYYSHEGLKGGGTYE